MGGTSAPGARWVAESNALNEEWTLGDGFREKSQAAKDPTGVAPSSRDQ